jgi:hypothetical protein
MRPKSDAIAKHLILQEILGAKLILTQFVAVQGRETGNEIQVFLAILASFWQSMHR